MNNMIEDQILLESEKLFTGERKELELYEPEFSSVREISLTIFFYLVTVFRMKRYVTCHSCQELFDDLFLQNIIIRLRFTIIPFVIIIH